MMNEEMKLELSIIQKRIDDLWSKKCFGKSFDDEDREELARLANRKQELKKDLEIKQVQPRKNRTPCIYTVKKNG